MEALPPNIGSIGDYRLIASLGEGGMGQVYLGMVARSPGFQKLLVLKVLRHGVNTEDDVLRSFLAETKIAARLNHPNVVQTYEAGVIDGLYFLAMEYLDGQALSSIFARVGRENIPLGVQLRILCDLLDGLDYAHDLADYDGTPLNLVHRDISPHNVIATYGGASKLVDFGIARVTGMTKTEEGVIKGKLSYMAPEQLCGTGVDRRADVFAVGVMLWESLAGRRLSLPGESQTELMGRRVAGTELKIRAVKPDTPDGLADICDKAMALKAAERFATAGEMRAAIEASAQPLGMLADARGVAAFLSSHFAEQREQLRRRIEDHIKSGGTAAPLLHLSRTDGGLATGSGDSARSGLALPELTGSGGANGIRVGDPDAATETRLLDRTPGAITAPSEGYGQSGQSGLGAGPRGRFANARFTVYAGAAATVLVVLGGAVALRPKEATAVAPPTGDGAGGSMRADGANATSAGADAAAAVTAPLRSSVAHVRLRVQPAEASVMVDGKPVQSAADLAWPIDGTSHTIVAQLGGYTTLARTIQAVEDQDIALQLSPLPPAPPAPPATTARQVRAPTAISSAPPKVPEPTRSRQRDIDQDPYK